jgi:chromodomain-helicase-DNA-binding protein 7
MVVSDLGHIVTDRPGFHSDRYIYPAGFKSSRLYFSTIEASRRVWYTSEIVDTGAKGSLFRVTMNDHPEKSFEGNSPSSAWSLIAMRVIEASGGELGAVRMSGPDYIGLSFPVIRYLIQRMNGAEKCVNYVMQRFEQPGV